MAASGPAAADILVNISKTSQRMTVLVDGSARYNWVISTGRGRYVTPSGVFRPTWMARKWRSRQYQNAPMPYSIFFNRGYAVHGTIEISQLGRPASHGCVRLHPRDAAVLFDLVKNRMAQTRIVVSNDAIGEPGQPVPKPPPFMAAGIAPTMEIESAAEIGTATEAEPAPLEAAEKPAASASPLEAETANIAPAPAEKTAGAQTLAQAPKPPASAPPARPRARTQPGFHW
ncbi:MAG: L,D-transpeptidase [Xanthobacteraceae bacterium]